MLRFAIMQTMKRTQPKAISTQHIAYVATGAFLLLLLPLIAMFFNPTVNWGAGDFLTAGVLLFGAGLLYILISTKLQSKRAKLVAGITILIILTIIWVELAVGIFSQ